MIGILGLHQAQNPDSGISAVAVVQVGFRHTCVRDGQLIHNGRPLLLRGVNRHEFDDKTGGGLGGVGGRGRGGGGYWHLMSGYAIRTLP